LGFVLTGLEAMPSIPHMRGCRRRSLALALLLIVGSVCGARAAAANPSADDQALASILFQEGRALMAAGRIPEACLKLEESQRLDPGGGTLLNLALCHEQEGRLARSWGEFKEAAIVAHGDGRQDREVEAVNHARALEPRLSHLTIVVPAGTQVEGLVIERDGRVVGRGAWSTAIPVDGGEHVVRATALGREPFSTKFVMAAESDARTMEIPVLATPIVVVTEPRVASPEIPAAPIFTPARLRYTGIAAAGVGVVLLGAASYSLATALSAKKASNSHCYPDGCDDEGTQKRNDAAARGNLATGLGIGGAVLVGAGVTLFYLGHRSNVASRQAQSTTRLVLGGAPGAFVAGIEGGFQ
jgi:hypothetical protein